MNEWMNIYIVMHMTFTEPMEPHPVSLSELRPGEGEPHTVVSFLQHSEGEGWLSPEGTWMNHSFWTGTFLLLKAEALCLVFPSLGWCSLLLSCDPGDPTPDCPLSHPQRSRCKKPRPPQANRIEILMPQWFWCMRHTAWKALANTRNRIPHSKWHKVTMYC